MGLKFFLTVCLSLSIGAALAAPASSTAPRQAQQDLNTVRKEIRTIQSDIAKKEAARNAAQSAIAESEQTLKSTRKELSSLGQQRLQSEQKLMELTARIETTQLKIANTRKRVTAMLTSQYHRGQHDAMVMLLNSGDPNQRSRDLVYYQHIAKAQTTVINQLRQQQTQLQTLSVQLEQELQRLNKLTGRKNTERTHLETVKTAQQVESAQLSSQIRNQQQKLAELKANEQRLSSLLLQIQRQAEAQRIAAAKQRKARQEAARKENERRRKAAEEAKKAGKPIPEDAKQPVQVETVDAVVDDSASGKAFRRLQGHMKLPVAGQLTGRFGSRREEGSTWKGVFISASPGQAVRSVADGRVAYASYLRGFGNTVIVDHGGNYLTVYTGLSSIGRNSGSSIRAGDTLGSSGTLESGETGLYFEIRYMGRPVNPMSWAR